MATSEEVGRGASCHGARLVPLETTALLSNERISERAYLLYSRGRGADQYLRLLRGRRESRSHAREAEVDGASMPGNAAKISKSVGY